MRYLIAVLMLGLLAACDLGAASPSGAPLPSIGSADESASADVSHDADASDDDGMTASCQEAWADLDISAVSDVDDLQMIATDLDGTLEACGSLDDWRDEAESALPEIDSSAIELWVMDRCNGNDQLRETPVCEELAG